MAATDMPEACACETLPVPGPGQMINIDATTARLLELVGSGDMVLLRADCPLEQTTAIFEAETRYTLRHFLRCRRCDRTVLYGLCIRGAPIFHYVEHDEPVTVPWEPSGTFVDVTGGPVQRYRRNT